MQERFGQEPQDILTNPLIEGTDGRKMSSSWGNTINFTDSPADMYAKVMRVNDDLIVRYFTMLTRAPISDVEAVETALADNSLHPRDAKMQLARAVVTLFHNADAANTAEQAFVSTVQKGETPDDVDVVHFKSGALMIDVYTKAKVVPSKTEFRRLVASGAITNKTTDEKVVDAEQSAQPGVYKVGKHRFVELKEEK